MRRSRCWIVMEMGLFPNRSWEWPCALWVTCPVRWSWQSSCRGSTWTVSHALARRRSVSNGCKNGLRGAKMISFSCAQTSENHKYLNTFRSRIRSHHQQEDSFLSTLHMHHISTRPSVSCIKHVFPHAWLCSHCWYQPLHTEMNFSKIHSSREQPIKESLWD